MNRLKEFLKGERFRELFIYGVVGVLTTAINYGAYASLTWGMSLLLGVAPDHPMLILAANIAAWVLSVAFAFWANKRYVFRSPGWTWPVLRRELPSFAAARLLSLGFDVVFMEAAVLLAGMDHRIAKLLSNVIVIILNYFASKFWIFRKRDS